MSRGWQGTETARRSAATGKSCGESLCRGWMQARRHCGAGIWGASRQIESNRWARDTKELTKSFCWRARSGDQPQRRGTYDPSVSPSIGPGDLTIVWRAMTVPVTWVHFATTRKPGAESAHVRLMGPNAGKDVCGLRRTGTTDCSCCNACSDLVWVIPGPPRFPASPWASEAVSCECINRWAA